MKWLLTAHTNIPITRMIIIIITITIMDKIQLQSNSSITLRNQWLLQAHNLIRCHLDRLWFKRRRKSLITLRHTSQEPTNSLQEWVRYTPPVRPINLELNLKQLFMDKELMIKEHFLLIKKTLISKDTNMVKMRRLKRISAIFYHSFWWSHSQFMLSSKESLSDWWRTFGA